MAQYFAYGSNMDEEDLNRWCEECGYPKVTFLRVLPAKLNNYVLSFNYFSISRNGGAANIMESKKDAIYGLLIELKDEDIHIIRKKEGFPNNYTEINVSVKTFDNILVENVKTYKVVKQRERKDFVPPTKYYLGLIIKNAKKYKFPLSYINFLESIPTKTD